MPLEITLTAKGFLVRLRVTPRARQDRIVGEHGGALKVHVREAPEHGRATEAVLALLAAALGPSGGQVALVSGGQSRDKRVLVTGFAGDARALEAHLLSGAG